MPLERTPASLRAAPGLNRINFDSTASPQPQANFQVLGAVAVEMQRPFLVFERGGAEAEEAVVCYSCAGGFEVEDRAFVAPRVEMAGCG